MSRCDQKYRMVDYFFDELSQADKQQLGEHVSTCQICQDHLRALAAASQMTRRLKRPRPDRALLRNYHHQLESYFADDQTPGRLVDRILDRLIRRPSIPIRLAEAMVLLLLGFFIGQMTMGRPELERRSILSNEASSDWQTESMLLKNYLQQAEMVFLDVKNLDPVEDQELIFNLIQSAKYRFLLQKTLLLRDQANDLENQRLSQLLNKIELILLELYNMESNGYVETLSLIKKQLKDTHLLIEITSLSQMEI